MNANTLWSFNTARFHVVCTAEEEWGVDLSWDETGEVAEKLNSGEYTVFCAKVAVYLDGREVAADYLGQCIYSDPADFVTEHRDPDRMNRNCSIRRDTDCPDCMGTGESFPLVTCKRCGGYGAYRGSTICHYFPDMVNTAISEARKALTDLPTLRAA